MLEQNVSKMNSEWSVEDDSLSHPMLFSDFQPLDELLDTYLLEDDPESIPNHHLKELICDSGADPSQPHLCAADNNHAETHSSPHTTQDFSSDHISDDDLVNLPIQDLNKRLKTLPRAEAQMLRKRRRILKNRSYATSCRQRRVASDESLKEQNQRLKDQLREIKEILRKTVVDRNLYKSKCERLEGLFQR